MDLKVGISFILFGIIVGGVGVVSAGVGVGVPMIPIGIYLIWRGLYRIKLSKGVINAEKYVVEKTPLGKFFLGILLTIIGLAFSAILIGVPIVIYGVYLIYSFAKPHLKSVFNK